MHFTLVLSQPLMLIELGDWARERTVSNTCRMRPDRRLQMPERRLEVQFDELT